MEQFGRGDLERPELLMRVRDWLSNNLLDIIGAVSATGFYVPPPTAEDVQVDRFRTWLETVKPDDFKP